jgi:hypothetical protein
MTDIPVLDFSVYGLRVRDPLTVMTPDLGALSDSLYHALSTVGFCYLTNHGIPEHLVRGIRGKLVLIVCPAGYRNRELWVKWVWN